MAKPPKVAEKTKHTTEIPLQRDTDAGVLIEEQNLLPISDPKNWHTWCCNSPTHNCPVGIGCFTKRARLPWVVEFCALLRMAEP